MKLQLTRIYAILITGLAIAGLFVSGHLFQLMNSDNAIDFVRVALAAFLLYAGFVSRDRGTAKTALLTVGFLYIGVGLIGLFSPTIGSLLPTGLTGFDIMFHLLTGAFATYVGARDTEQYYAQS